MVFDVFRLRAGQLAEHWDAVTDAATADESVSGHSNTDGATEVDSHTQTQANRQLVEAFVQRVFTDGEYELLADYIGETYIQHNPLADDGIEGLQAFVAQATAMNIALGYRESPLLMAEGNLVMVGSEGYFD